MRGPVLEQGWPSPRKTRELDPEVQRNKFVKYFYYLLPTLSTPFSDRESLPERILVCFSSFDGERGVDVDESGTNSRYGRTRSSICMAFRFKRGKLGRVKREAIGLRSTCL